MIDARSLVPFDYTEVMASVAKTGRLVCVSDANLRGSWLNTVAAKISTEAFDDLDAPVVVLGARNWIAPPAEMEWEFRNAGRHPRRDSYSGAAPARPPDPGRARSGGHARGVEPGYLIRPPLCFPVNCWGIPQRRRC